ncbi:ABC transporter substrate-binding protein [Polaromonas sp. P1(28)-8]|nr:ABC transporter substrate-binding protein [Polaromonas sp. P1(28)-8]
MKLNGLILALTVLLSGVSTQVAAQNEPGLSSDKIRIGMFAPLSGPSMAFGFDTTNAAKMYYDKINREGGIHGRKIEVVLEDDRCNANDLVAAVKKLVEQDKVFLLHGGSCSGATVAAKEYVERSKIPFLMLNASGDGILYPPSPYIFGGFIITQHAVGGSIISFASNLLKAKKIAYINHDDAYGAWNFEAAQFMAKQTPGVEVNVQSVNASITDVTALMLKIKASNPDVLVITTYARPLTLILKKAHEMGFNKPIVLAINGISDLKQLVENVGSKDAFKNVYIQEVLADVPGSPKMQWVYDLYKKSYPELAAKPGHPQPFMPQGIPSAMAIVNALKATGPNLTREKFIREVEKLKFDSGVTAGPTEFGPGDHAGHEEAIYFKFDGTNYTRIPGNYSSLWKYDSK